MLDGLLICRNSRDCLKHRLFKAKFLVLLGLLFLASCATREEPRPPKEQKPQAEAPFVTLVDPMPGTQGVDSRAGVTVQFSEPMDRGSVELALSVFPDVGVQLTWLNDKTLAISPKDKWPEGAAVEIVISRYARSLSGERLEKEFEWSYGIAPGGVRIASVRPEIGARGVPLDSEIRIEFKGPVNRNEIERSVRLEPNAQVRLKWEKNALIIEPENQWDGATEYVVSIEVSPQNNLTAANFITEAASFLWSVRPDGSGLTRKFKLPFKALRISWSPNGKLLLLLGEEHNGLSENFGPRASLWVLSSEGKLVTLGRIVWLDDIDPEVIWSPDGSALVLPNENGSNSFSSLSVIQLAGDKKTERLLYSSEGDGLNVAAPAWSPSGDLIAFRGYGDWKSHIFTINTYGQGRREVASFEVKRSEYSFMALSWAPDGKYLTVEEENKDWPVVWKVAPGSKPKVLFEGWHHVWSPRGDKIAFIGKDGLYTYNVSSGNLQRIAEKAVIWPASWSSDGKLLLFDYPSNESSVSDGIWVASADSGTVYKAADLPTWGAKDWGPDGSIWFVSPRGQR